MARYVEGRSRLQSFLLPESVEDYVDENNPVRAVEVFVDALDLAQLGFGRAVPAETGRPSYHPSTMLKIYLYGYLNRVQSSRRLEREAGRNLELIWLTGGLAPDFKTIADFRRANGPAIGGLPPVRGAVPSPGPVRPGHRRHRRQQVQGGQQSRQELHGRQGRQADGTDRRQHRALSRHAGPGRSRGQRRHRGQASRAKEKIAGLRRQMQFLKDMERQVEAAPDQQVSLTDPDARSMATSGHGTGVVGYNVQTAVDTQHHLIIAHEVTNTGHDRTQLVAMGLSAQEATGCKRITVLADRGYFNRDQVLACEDTGVLPSIHKTLTSSSAKRGLFTLRDFFYDAARDHYTCPAGQHLTRGAVRSDRRDDMNHHRHLTACSSCPLTARCTPDKLKRVKRWQHEGVLDAMQTRLDQMPDAMGVRRQTVEYPFGTLKSWMGSTHFLTRTLEKVRTEMSLHVLAYNMKRVTAILGVGTLMQAIRA